MLSTIILLLFILIFIIYTSRSENFTSLDKLVLELQNPNITKDNVLSQSQTLRGQSSVRLSNKNADDKMITEFIAKQLGKEDTNTPGSYNTNTNMLEYPKEEIPEKKQTKTENINYEDMIEKQERDIKNRKEMQDLTLRNIKYELMKLSEYRKPIFNIKNEYKNMQ